MDPDPNPDPNLDPDPNPDPNLDPDQKFPEKSDPNPDPKKIISDPQHWIVVVITFAVSLPVLITGR